MKNNITSELSLAIKSGDKNRIHTLRLILAAIKDKEIANRSSGEDSEISDESVIQLLKKMVKQRNDSCEAYKKAGRQELLLAETKEIEIISSFLPKQLSEVEIKKICEEIIKSNNAKSIKDMGKVMGELKKSKNADSLDFSKASMIIKEILK